MIKKKKRRERKGGGGMARKGGVKTEMAGGRRDKRMRRVDGSGKNGGTTEGRHGGKGKREEGRKTEMKKWREVPGAVVDPGEGSGRPGPPPLTLDQTEARRAEKKNF